MRKLGVHGKNLPAKRTLSVTAADFAIGGLLIDTERKYNRTYLCTTPEQFNEIFGLQTISTDYGPDAAKGFFDNIVGVDGSVYIQSLLGYTGGAIDAVVAQRDKIDVGSDANAYEVQPAFEDEVQYGLAGNRTGTKFIQAERAVTDASATCAATGQSYAELDSVIKFVVGDIVLFKTNSGASPVYKKIIQVDEATKRIYWTGDFEATGASGETLAIDDEVVISGFTVQTYVKSINGVETEVDTELGKIVCSSESEVTDFFVENVFEPSTWIKITVTSASTLGDRLPVTDSVIAYCSSGADGTTVTDSTGQAAFLANFDTDPIRFLANPETTDEAMQKGLILYSLARDDNPIIIVNVAENRTKSQLVTIGNAFQVSDFSPSAIVANWLKVEDPFSTSTVAPLRTVPNVGHVMGAWIKTIQELGVHLIPATSATTVKGVLGVVGDQLKDDRDRTDVADTGVNVIQQIQGEGIRIMNLFTTSTDVAYKFGNGILMRNFFKVSGEDSLRNTENTPNSLNRISASKMAMLMFSYKLWEKGSTGTVPVGETFGQGRDAQGNPTGPKDHFQVIADLTNNPQANINLGERNVWMYFTFPAPAGSIQMGVGILLR